MEIISSHDLKQFCMQDCLKVIKLGPGTRPKVCEKDNTIIKLFYPKKTRLSSNTIRPRALRFYKNSQRLRSKGYTAPNIVDHQYCKEQRIHLIHYDKIEGSDVRSLAKLGNLAILDGVATLMGELHQQGICIRSIHLENLLYQNNGELGLIDVTDVQFRTTSLRVYARFRNVKHLLTRKEDVDIWKQYGIERFLEKYFQAEKLNGLSKSLLVYLIHKYL